MQVREAQKLVLRLQWQQVLPLVALKASYDPCPHSCWDGVVMPIL